MNQDIAVQRPTVPSEYFVDAEEAAKFLKINPRTLLQMARCNSVPAHPLGDSVRKTWRFLLSELGDWLRSRVSPATDH